MRIAFFGSGPAPNHAALLVSHALTGSPDAARPVENPDDLGPATEAGAGHLFLSASASALRAAGRAGLDLAVVLDPGGGRGAGIAVREAGRPVWRLPCVPVTSGAAAIRTLPLMLPPFGAAQAARLRLPELPDWQFRLAATLAAAVVLAASDPFAPYLGPSRLREVFRGEAAREIAARSRLQLLAATFPDVRDDVRSGSGLPGRNLPGAHTWRAAPAGRASRSLRQRPAVAV